MDHGRVHSTGIEKEFSSDLLDEFVIFITDGSVVNGGAVLYLCPILDGFHLAWPVVELFRSLVFELLECLGDLVLHTQEHFAMVVVPS